MRHKRLLFILVLAACIALATQAWAVQNAPTDVQAAPGNKSAAVSFDAPTASNGGAITGYTVVSNPSGGVDSDAGSTSPIHLVTGLTNGQPYTFTVTATGTTGTSPPSAASNTVTPSETCLAQLAGTWHMGEFVSGLSIGGWARCTEMINPDGTYTGSCTDMNNVTTPNSGTQWAFPYGLWNRDSVSPDPNSIVVVNEDHTVAVGAESGTGGVSYLFAAVKQGDSYSIANGQGNGWGDFLNCGSSPYWMQTRQTANSTGYVTGSWTTSAGNSGTFAQQTALSPYGEFTCVSGDCDPTAISFVDPGGTVAVGTSGPDATTGDAAIYLLIKQAASYSMADLAGEWAGKKVYSDGTWKKLSGQIGADGSATMTQVDSDGTISTGIANLIISPDGVVSCAPNQPIGASCDSNLVMDASKTVMTETKGTNTVSINILVKTAPLSLWQNAISTGGGWYYLSPFGAFNTNASPWIYHQGLGWLYPIGTSTDSIWFYDPQWDGHGGWWWTSSSLFPWIYTSSQGGWLYFDSGDSTPGVRWFFTGTGQASVH